MLALILYPFIEANGDDGIAEGVIDSGVLLISPGQEAAFNALDSFCAQTNTLSLACGLTSLTSDFNQQIEIPSNATQLQQLSPQAAIQSESIAISSPYQFIRSVNKHTEKRIDCANLDSEESVLECNRGGGGSHYGFIGPFGVSISGGGGLGDRNNAAGQTGFRLDTRQANLMIDYSFNPEMIAGFSFGYFRTERTLGLDSGNLDSDSYRFAPFFTFRPNSNSYLTLMGGYARVDYDSRRRVTEFAGITVSDATAEYNADQYFASVGGGYIFAFKDGWNLRGYARADYSNLDIDGFQENGGIGDDNEGNNSYAMKVNRQSVNSATTTVGAELSYAISTSTLYPAVVIPRLRAEWVHEFKNNDRTTQASFNQNDFDSDGNLDPINLGPMDIAGPERNWGNVGFGLQMLFPNAIVGYINYDALIIDRASNHTITGGIRINF